MVMELNSGRMELNMSVNGNSTKHVDKVNSGTLMEIFLRGSG